MDDLECKIGAVHLKRWWDRYPCFVEIKGGTVPLKAQKFIVTSNSTIEEIVLKWCGGATESTRDPYHPHMPEEYDVLLKAIRRRVHKYYKWIDHGDCTPIEMRRISL